MRPMCGRGEDVVGGSPGPSGVDAAECGPHSTYVQAKTTNLAHECDDGSDGVGVQESVEDRAQRAHVPGTTRDVRVGR